MAEKRPDQLPAITGMSDTDIFIIQKNISDPDVSSRTVGQIAKGDLGFLPTTGGSITGPLGLSGDVTVAGDILPAISGGANLGAPTKPFATGFFTSGTIELGEVCLKAGSHGLIVENGHGIGGTVSGSTGYFRQLYVDGQRIEPEEENIVHTIASGSATSSIVFGKVYDASPFVVGSFHLAAATTNFYSLNFSNVTTSGCTIIYSSDIEEAGNEVHLTVKDR